MHYSPLDLADVPYDGLMDLREDEPGELTQAVFDFEEVQGEVESDA